MNKNNKMCFHYNDNNKREIKQSIAKNILAKFKKSNKKELVIVNIGTDKCIGDSVAPLVGTILERDNSKITFYGSCKNPIHALNINYTMDTIYKKHPSGFIVGVDACIGEEDDIGKVMYRENKGISAGKGVGKTLPVVGDCSIVGIVEGYNNQNALFGKNIRLSFILELSENIADIIKELNDKNNLKLINCFSRGVRTNV